MKDILISLFQHVYFCYNEKALLIYDTAKNKTYEQSLEELHYTVKENVIIFHKATDSVLLFASTLAKNNVAYVAPYRKGDKAFLCNYYDKVAHTYREVLELPNSVVEDSIHEISVHLDSSYELFSLNESQNTDKKIDYESLKMFFSGTRFNNIGKIRFIAREEINNHKLRSIIKSFGGKINVELIISLKEYIKHRKKGALIKDNRTRYTIICDSSCRERIFREPGLIKTLGNVCFLVPFKSKADLREVSRIEFPDDKKIVMNPIYEDNYSFLFKTISYNKKDVLNVSYNIKDIARKEVLNELYWGKLSIDYKGDMYAGPKLKIGGIKNFKVSDYSLLLSKDSLWRKVRSGFSFCKNCVYRNLCPSLSFTEIQSDKAFCTFGNP